jgi:hypothetical protein
LCLFPSTQATHTRSPSQRRAITTTCSARRRGRQVKDLTAELDRLYARYRELEEQKRPLLARMGELARVDAGNKAPQRAGAWASALERL